MERRMYIVQIKDNCLYGRGLYWFAITSKDMPKVGMKKKYRYIETYKDYFEKFFVKQDQKVKDKIIWTLELIEDIEQMEKLGIYEVVEEDFALCEFVCTSKMEVQSIIRNGLDLIKKECS